MGSPKPRAQQKLAAENVQRQVTVTIVVAVIEPPLLVAVYRIVGGIRVQNDLQGRLLMRLQKMIDEQTIDRRVLPANLLVRVGAERTGGGELQPGERTPSRQRLAPIPFPSP